MKYLIVQGSSIQKVFCHCSVCGKQAVWLKLTEIDTGLYKAICAKCRKRIAGD